MGAAGCGGAGSGFGSAASSARVYGCSGAVNTRSTLALLDDAALFHDAHPLRDFAHDAEIVGDEEERHAEPLLDVLQQRDDLRLYGDVERVVGSSAMSRSGSLASAMAIITRWRWPPDN